MRFFVAGTIGVLARGYVTAADVVGGGEGIHLFRDDIGVFPDAAGEELGGLKDRGADLTEAVAREEGAGGGLDLIPEGGFWREEVACPAYLEQYCHGLG